MVGLVGDVTIVSAAAPFAVLMPTLRGPVRAAEGRICSKPWDAATRSMDLKY
jgi:hypothetical protein